MNNGKSAVFATTLGICSGLIIYATLSALGFAAILQSSPKVFQFIQVLGAGYLIFLGGSSIREALKTSSTAIKSSNKFSDLKKINVSFKENFTVGFLTNILNPKVALFYVTFLPQFINPTDHIAFSSFLLASIHILMSFVWLNLIGQFIVSFQKYLLIKKVKKNLEIFTGFVLVIFGVWMIQSF